MENNIAILSIYYSREEWATLIKKCIIPLIRSMYLNKEDSDINTLIKLYGNNELNCQLIIYGISERFTETINHIEKRIKAFVEQYPSKESESYSFKPGQVLWMPQRNNSILLHFIPVESYFKYPGLLFYRQSITNLLLDWFGDNEDVQFEEGEVYSFTLFIQLILLKMIAHHKLPVNFTQLFSALEASLDVSNNMSLYNEVIENSSAGFNKNIEQIKEYYSSIELENEEDDILHLHYTTIRSFLFNNSGMYLGDRTIQLLISAGYDLLGMNGITQLYIQNMLKVFCSEHFKMKLTKVEAI